MDHLAGAKKWTTLSVLSLSLAMLALDNTILNAAIPELQSAFAASTSSMQWILNSYSLVLAGVLLWSGALGDRIGRRRILLFGFALFGFASLFAGLSHSAFELIIWRALMGLGAALIMPSTLSLLATIFPDKNERSVAISCVTAVGGCAVAAGPILGGVLLEFFDWRAIFWMNPLFSLVMAAGVIFLMPESRNPQAEPIDLPGCFLSLLGLTTLVGAIIEVSNSGLGLFSAAILIISICSLSAFVVWQSRAPNPLLPLKFFTNAAFSLPVIVIGMIYFSYIGLVFFAPQYLQMVKGYSPYFSGIAMVPTALGLVAGSLITPACLGSLGYRRLMLVVLLIFALALGGMSQVEINTYFGLTACLMFLTGLCMGIMLPAMTDCLMSSVPDSHTGLSAAVGDSMCEIGCSLGVAVLGTVMAVSYKNQIELVIAASDPLYLEIIPSSVVTASKLSLATALPSLNVLTEDWATPIRKILREAFLEAMSGAMLFGALTALVTAWLVFKWMPERDTQTKK